MCTAAACSGVGAADGACRPVVCEVESDFVEFGEEVESLADFLCGKG